MALAAALKESPFIVTPRALGEYAKRSPLLGERTTGVFLEEVEAAAPVGEEVVKEAKSMCQVPSSRVSCYLSITTMKYTQKFILVSFVSVTTAVVAT